MTLEELITFKPRRIARSCKIPESIMRLSLPNYAKVGRFILVFGAPDVDRANWLVVECPPDDSSANAVWKHIFAGKWSLDFSRRATRRYQQALALRRDYRAPEGISMSLWADCPSRPGLQIHSIWNFRTLKFERFDGASRIARGPYAGATCVLRNTDGDEGFSRGCAFASRLGWFDGNTFNDPEALAASSLTQDMWPSPTKRWMSPQTLIELVSRETGDYVGGQV